MHHAECERGTELVSSCGNSLEAKSSTGEKNSLQYGDPNFTEAGRYRDIGSAQSIKMKHAFSPPNDGSQLPNSNLDTDNFPNSSIATFNHKPLSCSHPDEKADHAAVETVALEGQPGTSSRTIQATSIGALHLQLSPPVLHSLPSAPQRRSQRVRKPNHPLNIGPERAPTARKSENHRKRKENQDGSSSGSDGPVRRSKYIGLKNQGATCYINCLVQSLFHLPKFKELVDGLEYKDRSQSQTSIALQKVFRGLLTGVKPISTKILTRALGLEADVNVQQDVQEYLGMVLANLESEVEGTPAADMMKSIFYGRVEKLIRCLRLEHEVSKEEGCAQLSLVVKGCRDLRESLEQYFRPETLTGDNQYRVEGHGLQDVAKQYRFLRLPPVLTLCLRRFEYNRKTSAVSKVHQWFEFPTCIDLSRFLHSTSPQDTKPSTIEEQTQNTREDEKNRGTDGGGQAGGPPDSLYLLHSVFVHSGNAQKGHYNVYIRPTPTIDCTEGEWEDGGQWYLFDDEQVREVEKREAVDLCFGPKKKGDSVGATIARMKAEEAGLRARKKPPTDNATKTSKKSQKKHPRRSKCAYMLIYARASELLYTPKLSKTTAKLVEKMDSRRLEAEKTRIEVKITSVKPTAECPGCVKMLQDISRGRVGRCLECLSKARSARAEARRKRMAQSEGRTEPMLEVDGPENEDGNKDEKRIEEKSVEEKRVEEKRVEEKSVEEKRVEEMLDDEKIVEGKHEDEKDIEENVNEKNNTEKMNEEKQHEDRMVETKVGEESKNQETENQEKKSHEKKSQEKKSQEKKSHEKKSQERKSQEKNEGGGQEGEEEEIKLPVSYDLFELEKIAEMLMSSERSQYVSIRTRFREEYEIPSEQTKKDLQTRLKKLSTKPRSVQVEFVSSFEVCRAQLERIISNEITPNKEDASKDLIITLKSDISSLLSLLPAKPKKRGWPAGKPRGPRGPRKRRQSRSSARVKRTRVNVKRTRVSVKRTRVNVKKRARVLGCREREKAQNLKREIWEITGKYPRGSYSQDLGWLEKRLLKAKEELSGIKNKNLALNTSASASGAHYPKRNGASESRYNPAVELLDASHSDQDESIYGEYGTSSSDSNETTDDSQDPDFKPYGRCGYGRRRKKKSNVPVRTRKARNEEPWNTIRMENTRDIREYLDAKQAFGMENDASRRLKQLRRRESEMGSEQDRIRRAIAASTSAFELKQNLEAGEGRVRPKRACVDMT